MCTVFSVNRVQKSPDLSVVARQEHDCKRDEDDQQNGEACADGADEIAERSYVLDKFGMVGGVALDGLPQKRDLVLDPLHLDGLILNLEMQFPMASLDFLQTLMQFFLYCDL